MELEIDNHVRPFHVFVRLLSGDTKTLLFDSPLVPALAVKQRISDIAKLPVSQQRLICAGRQLDDAALIPSPDSTVHLLLRLRGGKGGFGSLLRGAATKAGQKKTNNFDACRDMSGRRLRHVNAEKKLEEWRAEEEERRLEKIAQDFIKKAAKKGKKGVGEGEALRYVEKYREESAKCVAQVELSVREAMGSSSATFRKSLKRKPGEDAGIDGKKLKIWMGKRKLADSDSDDMDEDSSDDDDEEEAEENEKSVILDNTNSSDSAKDGEESSDSLSGGRQEGISTAASSESGSGEERETIFQESSVSAGCSPKESSLHQQNGTVEPVYHGGKEDRASTFPSSDEAAASEDDANLAEKEESNKFKHGNDEVLGLERLKMELQLRGLKCGGTLQERASRLFLFKSTPLDKVPKKLLAKK
ncbi:hypothetical protein CRG98_039129 [Punica granatum]|uniref:Ubiquitin-like domain-containing protein n=1 Tax=Punica granatum TaxID=22663 RepID=A0A2I0I9L4_PUNGR|nr:hypothetical protein CRG98_039129 [Punica granatum]